MSVTIRPRVLAAKGHDPVRTLRPLWLNRALTLQLISQEVAQRYRGSYLAIDWSFKP